MILMYSYTSVRKKLVRVADLKPGGGQCGVCGCVLIIVYSSFRQQHTIDLLMFVFFFSKPYHRSFNLWPQCLSRETRTAVMTMTMPQSGMTPLSPLTARQRGPTQLALKSISTRSTDVCLTSSGTGTAEDRRPAERSCGKLRVTLKEIWNIKLYILYGF